MKSLLCDINKLIGCKEIDNTMTDDESKNIATRIIAYNQMLYCYKRMDDKDIYADLPEEQASDRKMCEARRIRLVGSMYALK